MLTTNQEILIDMIEHIEDKETKAKFIRKIKENFNTNTLPLQNTYRFKDIMKQFEIKKRIKIQDLQIKIKQIKIKQIKKQIEELKVFTQNIDSRLQNIENQEISLKHQTTEN